MVEANLAAPWRPTHIGLGLYLVSRARDVQKMSEASDAHTGALPETGSPDVVGALGCSPRSMGGGRAASVHRDLDSALDEASSALIPCWGGIRAPQDAGDQAAELEKEQAPAEKELDLLTCPICLELLARPVTLRCGHTFCAHCAKWAIRRLPRCPVCRAVVAYADRVIERRLPINTVLARLLESNFGKEYATRLDETSANVQRAHEPVPSTVNRGDDDDSMWLLPTRSMLRLLRRIPLTRRLLQDDAFRWALRRYRLPLLCLASVACFVLAIRDSTESPLTLRQAEASLCRQPQDCLLRTSLSLGQQGALQRLDERRSGGPAREWLNGLFRDPSGSETRVDPSLETRAEIRGGGGAGWLPGGLPIVDFQNGADVGGAGGIAARAGWHTPASGVGRFAEGAPGPVATERSAKTEHDAAEHGMGTGRSGASLSVVEEHSLSRRGDLIESEPEGWWRAQAEQPDREEGAGDAVHTRRAGRPRQGVTQAAAVQGAAQGAAAHHSAEQSADVSSEVAPHHVGQAETQLGGQHHRPDNNEASDSLDEVMLTIERLRTELSRHETRKNEMQQDKQRGASPRASSSPPTTSAVPAHAEIARESTPFMAGERDDRGRKERLKAERDEKRDEKRGDLSDDRERAVREIAGDLMREIVSKPPGSAIGWAPKYPDSISAGKVVTAARDGRDGREGRHEVAAGEMASSRRPPPTPLPPPTPAPRPHHSGAASSSSSLL